MKLENKTLIIKSYNFKQGEHLTAKINLENILKFEIQEREPIPFNQCCIHKEVKIAELDPITKKPFFTVTQALPIPTAYNSTR